ncbi:leucyl aminopeptidase [Helicobacter aurati]|uniref:Probable cytosol aminopeptidase n=1 Tax=Helicobacter aurati TaxID=137778 RepID=A0A3D8J321_9HELI|nr:leucyl aminopeptidase [Helicobacter aurati]RDU71650.1 leucyl aminopeptidase [Helicobacter aurati]
MNKQLWVAPKINISVSDVEFGTAVVLIEKDIFAENSSVILETNKENVKDLALLTQRGYKGKGAFYAQASNILYVGLEDLNPYSYADAACLAIKTLKTLNIKEAFFALKDKDESLHKHIIRGILLGDYEYNVFKQDSMEKSQEIKQREILNLALIGVRDNVLQQMCVICNRVNFVRDIVNTPPNIANAIFLSNLAQNETIALAKKYRNCDIQAVLRSNSYMEEQKMGAFLAVNQTSNFPAFLAHLSYKPQHVDSSTKKVVIVGKGLVYDTGGLSLKPADYMVTMKADKSGACAVLGVFLAAVELGLNIELHAIMGITDNAIGSNAYRPDDILISREKKSIEVKNTDAEGRLVLVDCLSYAQDLEADMILDFATLTGACVVALGEYTSGVMGYNEKLKQLFVESALKSGELAHTLPFNSHLKKLIESKIADVSNTSSSRYGGAITAGMFLGEFIRKEYKDKWLHIDIAGPAFVEKEWGVNPYGASGAGVLACIQFLCDVIQ